MLSENVQVLNSHPECTLQEAANFPDSSAPAKAAQVGIHLTKKTRSFFQFQILIRFKPACDQDNIDKEVPPSP